ncbi:hypothetical protein KQX54_015640 [Cotesia glomerata]|uniref:Uncharacterized protein n=1 Tax=Cotesia glomerata TaxID=32391 RepID=A0AAV7I0A5_COTGL|nr:hypothetical protein KQX54_015640 [Cotesia glomerata]
MMLNILITGLSSMGLKAQKALVSVEDAVKVLKKHIKYFIPPEKQKWSSEVWKLISKDLNDKWNVDAVRTNVNNDRRNILTIALKETGFFSDPLSTEPNNYKNETSIEDRGSPSSSEDEDDDTKDPDYCHDGIFFDSSDNLEEFDVEIRRESEQIEKFDLEEKPFTNTPPDSNKEDSPSISSWVRGIIKAANNQIVEGKKIQSFYLSSLVKPIIDVVVEFPLWTNICIPYTDLRAISSYIEEDFKDLKISLRHQLSEIDGIDENSIGDAVKNTEENNELSGDKSETTLNADEVPFHSNGNSGEKKNQKERYENWMGKGKDDNFDKFGWMNLETIEGEENMLNSSDSEQINDKYVYDQKVQDDGKEEVTVNEITVSDNYTNNIDIDDPKTYAIDNDNDALDNEALKNVKVEKLMIIIILSKQGIKRIRRQFPNHYIYIELDIKTRLEAEGRECKLRDLPEYLNLSVTNEDDSAHNLRYRLCGSSRIFSGSLRRFCRRISGAWVCYNDLTGEGRIKPNSSKVLPHGVLYVRC